MCHKHGFWMEGVWLCAEEISFEKNVQSFEMAFELLFVMSSDVTGLPAVVVTLSAAIAQDSYMQSSSSTTAVYVSSLFASTLKFRHYTHGWLLGTSIPMAVAV